MPSRRPTAVGAHVFVAGGLSRRGLPYADEIGAEALQVFVANPRGWALPADDLAGDERFRSACADRGVGAFVHAPYLCNLASPTEVTRERTVVAVRHSIARGARIGATGVVVHAGSAVEAGHREIALKVVRELLLPLLEDTSGDGAPWLLIEPTAGGGQPLAAGHDVSTAAGMRRTLTALIRAVGSGRIRLVHANDSKDPLGSGRDRHTNIGTGLIGTEPFGELFRHPALRGVPVVVETPGDVDVHREELALLRALRDR